MEVLARVAVDFLKYQNFVRSKAQIGFSPDFVWVILGHQINEG